MPGSIFGLHIGAAVEAGIPAVIQRTVGDPATSVKFFAGFATVALAVTFIYRIPRWYFAGRHRIFWWSAFLSGAFTVGLGISTVVFLIRIGIYNGAGFLNATHIAFLVPIALGCIVVGVETEAWLARFRTTRQAVSGDMD